MITCTKRYDNLPFAHRQPNHEGHCSLIHGHNWSFEFEFKASKLDGNGFVIDFGDLKWPDHALAIPWRSATGKVQTIQRRHLGDCDPKRRYVIALHTDRHLRWFAQIETYVEGHPGPAVGWTAACETWDGALECARQKIIDDRRRQ